MRKLALLAVLVAAAASATTASASSNEHLRLPVEDSFFAPFLSEICGVPVRITIDGVANVRLQRNDAGLVVREHDVLTSFTAVFDSPVEWGGTGLSFTNRSPGVTIYDYGDGATLGSPVTVTLVGFQGWTAGPGSVAMAGRQTFAGTVVGFSPEGIPFVDFGGDPLGAHGHWPPFELII